MHTLSCSEDVLTLLRPEEVRTLTCPEDVLTLSCPEDVRTLSCPEDVPTLSCPVGALKLVPHFTAGKCGLSDLAVSDNSMERDGFSEDMSSPIPRDSLGRVRTQEDLDEEITFT